MVDPQIAYQQLIGLLDSSGVEYKLFEHRATLTYKDLAAVQRETGFSGTEGKCLVLRIDDRFVVYVTLQGNRVDMAKVKETTGAKKVKLATAEELREHFGAEPGCAYPFGFSAEVAIYVDPKIYQVEWFLFSPVLSTRTVQARGADLRKVFSMLPNRVGEGGDFNTNE